MPKKAKVNKLARMSDEERARYLQHRADMEEEARRRKRELIARFIKNKLDKEEQYNRMNTAKLNQNWRYILRKVKCKQMASEIQGMRSSFNFLMERKNRVLKSLQLAIEDSDEQHRRAFQTHTENLNYFLGIGSERLDKLQNEYDYQKNSLLENWDKEFFDITGNQEKADFKLQLIVFIQENDFKNYKIKNYLEAATAKNEARLEHEEEMWDLRRPKELEIESYWTRIREVYNNYLEQHKPIMDHYNSLREKDCFYQQDIAKNEVLIQQATESLLNLQREWVKTTALNNYKATKMNKQKEQLAKRYWQLKKSTKLNLCVGTELLTHMVNTSEDVIKRLKEVKEKMNKIMQMAEICGKYEIHKFSNFDTDDQQLDASEESFENLDKAMIDECKQYSKMDKFFLKMNRVKVQTMCLKAEKMKLLKENSQLKNYIKRYLTELALKDGKSQRPVSVKVHSDVKIVEGTMYKVNRPVTCIEGALSNAVLHEKRMKIFQKRNQEMAIRSYPRIQCWMEAS